MSTLRGYKEARRANGAGAHRRTTAVRSPERKCRVRVRLRSFYDRKVWEQLTHFYDINAWLPRNYVFVNKDAWNELDENTRNVIKGLAMLAEPAGTAKARQLSDWYVTQLVSHGLIVQSVNEQLRSDFEQIGATMIQEWLSEAGGEGKGIIDAYSAM